MTDRIAFQGEPGANSDIAARAAYPMLEPLPCPSFEDAFAAVRNGTARYAMIPIENSLAGRVADVHHLMPDSGLHIVGERFEPIRHQLLGANGASIADLREVRSHPQALGQCRKLLRKLGVAAVQTADTAGAAREVAELGDPSVGALASSLAGKIHNLRVLQADVADADHNTTRFLVFAREAQVAVSADNPCITSFVFRVRNMPAALYKSLGGFAANSVNLTKLESYIEGGAFEAAMFFAEIEGHIEEHRVQLAFDELRAHSTSLTVLGVYPADVFRRKQC